MGFGPLGCWSAVWAGYAATWLVCVVTKTRCVAAERTGAVWWLAIAPPIDSLSPPGRGLG